MVELLGQQEPIGEDGAIFYISDTAAKRINFLAQKEENPNLVKLRISVLGGGCSGFQYHMVFDQNHEEGDYTFEKDGAKVVIDNTSMEFLNKSKLEYIKRLGHESFEIINPNATSSCGCGNSFSI